MGGLTGFKFHYFVFTIKAFYQMLANGGNEDFCDDHYLKKEKDNYRILPTGCPNKF